MTKGEGTPRFGSREEEALFWDQVDVSTLPSQDFEPADIEVGPRGKPITTTLAIRFDQRTVQLLRALAKSQGLGATQVVRAWVLERLRIEQEAGALGGVEGSEIEAIVARRVIDKLMTEAPSAARELATQVLQDVKDAKTV